MISVTPIFPDIPRYLEEPLNSEAPDVARVEPAIFINGLGNEALLMSVSHRDRPGASDVLSGIL